MLYELFELIIETLNSINIVEYWKSLCWILYNKKNYINNVNSEECKRIKGIAIDLFIILKYIFLVTIFLEAIPQNILILYLIWYLLIMNVFTYFYYHIWENKKTKRLDSKKRFVNFILAIIYSSLSFMVLYKNYYISDFETNNIFISNTVKAFSLSFGSFFNINNIYPITSKGYLIFTINCIINFIFLAFILSNTNISCEEDN